MKVRKQMDPLPPLCDSAVAPGPRLLYDKGACMSACVDPASRTARLDIHYDSSLKPPLFACSRTSHIAPQF
eukprot:6345-Eustigmatos_ZCMA.PRE.1